MEEDGEASLKAVLKRKKIQASINPKMIAESENVIVVIGTPVDEHLNPRVHDIMSAIKGINEFLDDGQLLIMRSTLYPGTTDKIHVFLQQKGKKTSVAFCPERIVEGYALRELHEIPQIVSGCSKDAQERAHDLFTVISPKIVISKPIEAEMAKLFTNTWRYINFAISNQFYMIAANQGIDFYTVYNAMVEDYPRLKSFAKAGFAAGPCLLQDTMQLSAYSSNDFFLGHAAMLVNEGLPDFIVETLKQKNDLSHLTVAILGMAFKGDNDDPRESLSYRLKKRLEIETQTVLCHDPYIDDSSFVSLDKIHKQADIVIVGATHSVYKQESWDNQKVIDVWNFYGKGSLM